MNQIRAIQALNKREIENGIPPEASWHTDYRDAAFVYFGGLPYDLSEGDVITIFSQFGEPVFLKLVRDKETGKSKGFGWLKYEDQRSTDLAVDNLGGAEIGGRLIRVDHARYKARDDEDLDECKIGWEDMLRRERAEKGLRSEDESEDASDEEARPSRPMIKEERELQMLIQDHDDEDPMKQFLIDEKKKEVEEALRKEKKRTERRSRKHRDEDRHHRHRSHRSRRDESDDEGRSRDKDKDRDRDDRDVERKHRSRRDETPVRARRGSSNERRERRRRDSPARERGRGDRQDRDHPRKEDYRHRDDRSDDGYGKDRDRHRRSAREDVGSRGERQHRDLEDRRRRDKARSRSRPPRPYRD
ncbi:RNA-binding motif protein, X-linked 2 [Madurella mycetomatis]|uniref:RNA-binding motif protein, X-linked 2 n=1 Tax=Madurella mycetomatis TaxID=100816 RepID=A0A175WFV5_9PEZI|nr:RNA-binding motif protein, X-linked 2 [Madurella mycetomatis]